MSPDILMAFRIVDMVGVVLNGILGGMIARKRRFDIVGFAVLALISALGGGVIRDVLLQAGGVAAIADPTYVACALLGAVIAFLVRLKGRVWQIFFALADAVVLGAWAATGTVKALSVGVHPLPAFCLGLCTAIGGGMVRDIAVGRVPEVFGGNRLYAVPAAASAVVVLAGQWASVPAPLVLVVATVVGASLAMLARRLGWTLPVHGDGTYTAVRERIRGVWSRSPGDEDEDS